MHSLARAVLFTVMLSGQLIAAQAQSPVRGPAGSISGRVTIKGTAAPGVTVVLLPPDFLPQQKPVARATTDEEGRFRLTGVAAGRYNVMPVTPVFVVPSEGDMGMPGKSVTIAEGEVVENIDFTLTRGGVITGRITDADGRPVIGEHVQLAYAGDNGMRRVGFFNPFMYETDDRGVYRIYGVAAGRYTVSLGFDKNSRFIDPRSRPYPRTFYPGVKEESAATVIEVTEGSEATNVDIALGRPSEAFRATGRIVDAESGKPVPNISYDYSPMFSDAGPAGIMGGGGARSDAQGNFQLEGLTPGRYAAFTTPFGNENDYYSEPAVFEVTSGDVNGLEIKVHHGSTISGVITVDGTDERTVLARLPQLQLGAHVETRGTIIPNFVTPSRIGADGSFHISGIRPGKARISLSGYPPLKGFSILRIERDGVEQRDGIEVAQGEQVSGVHVILGYGTGVIRGQVKVENGALPEGVRMSVYAKPLSAEMYRAKPAEIDARGRFLIEGLTAGQYELTLSTYDTRPGANIRVPPVKQTVNVMSAGESEVTLVLDLSAGEKKGAQ